MLSLDFTDILSAFSEEKVEYMVVGGYAIAFYGYVRGTGDIDLWIRVSNENADRAWRALKIFGAPLFDLKKADLLTPGIVFQMGIPPNRIDIINQITGVDFDEAWTLRTHVEYENLRIPLIGKAQLLENKRKMDRPKDRADIVWLESN